MLFTNRTLATALLGLTLFSANGQTGKINNTALDKRIKELTEKYRIPSAEAVIVRNDSIVYTYSSKKVNGNYFIGSCSKSFTALTIMRLAEKGMIDIQKPVVDYLPWFTLPDKKTASQIKVVHLLNQTSGIGGNYGFFDFKTEDTALFREKLKDHLEKVVLISVPGENFNYSNLNYLLLGMVAEAATKQKYASLVQKEVFEPLGMKNSYAETSEEVLGKNVEPFQYLVLNTPAKARNYPHSDLSAAFGFISSDINDLSKYLNFMIRQGITANGDTLVNSDTYKGLITPAKGNYAMGWTAVEYNGLKTILHTGLDENYSAILAFYPELNTGIVVLCNINSLEFCTMVQIGLSDMLAGKDYFEPPSLDLILRYGSSGLMILTILLLIPALLRWKKYAFKPGLVRGILPWIGLIAGSVLSIIPLIAVRINYNIPLPSIIDFQPDIAWALIITAICGTAASLIWHFGTCAKRALRSPGVS